MLGFPGGSIVKTLSNIYGWIILGFLGVSLVKNVPDNAGDVGLIPRLGRYPGDRNGNPLQYSCLGNLMDRRVWWATIHGVAKSHTWLRTKHAFIFKLPIKVLYLSKSRVNLPIHSSLYVEHPKVLGPSWTWKHTGFSRRRWAAEKHWDCEYQPCFQAGLS